jgi:putative redox protein
MPLQEQIQFTNHLGENLAGSFHVPSEDSSRGIVLGHCFTCSRHTRVLRGISSTLVDEGFKVLRFDFSGNGQSEGSFSESFYSKQITEMKAAVSFMSAQKIPWIGFVGHSMGGMVALLAAAEMANVRAVCTLAAKASALDTTRWFSQSQRQELERAGRLRFISRGRSLELTEDFFKDAAQYHLADIMASLRQPLLLVHGDQDEIISVQETHKLHQFKPMDTELAIIPGADHMFSQDEHRQQVAELVGQWFTRLALEDGF